MGRDREHDERGGRLHLALEILRRIPHGQGFTARQLHMRLQTAGIVTSLRTVQRILHEDLVPLCAVVCSQDKMPFRYAWPQQEISWPQALQSPQDSMLVAMARAHLALPAVGTPRPAQGWENKLHVLDVPVPRHGARMSEVVLSTLCTALYHDLEVLLHQVSGEIPRRLRPLGLLVSQGQLDLVALALPEEALCHLPLAGMGQVELTAQTFQRPPGFDLTQALRSRLRFHTSKAIVAQLLDHPQLRAHSVTEHHQGVEVSAYVLDETAAQAWLHRHKDDIWNVDKNAWNEGDERT